MQKILTILIIIILLAGCATLPVRKPSEAAPPEGYEKIGTVDAELRTWNWLFMQKSGERLEELKRTATQNAKAEYGEDILLITESTVGKWNPLSLLMVLGAAGFVEDAKIQASVWSPLPKNYGYRYAVIPEGDYNGDWGFMKVEYRTRDQLIEQMDAKLESGEIKQSSYNLRFKKLPATGKIFITLGRQEIKNAISRWFTFTCTWNGKTVFRKRGIEDIPYVYGTDRLWWNDKAYNVGPAWDGELKLVIEDSYRNEVFNFKVIKQRYVIEE